MTTYIILSTSGIGGAEKRFVELWLNIQRKQQENKIKLIIPRTTFVLINKIDQFNDINSYQSNIIIYDLENQNYFYKRKILKKILKKYASTDSVFHFIMGYPVFTNLTNNFKIIYTYTSTSFEQMNFKGLLVTFLSFFEATKIDVLDPNITNFLKKLFFWKKKHISNTPSSFVDVNYYKVEPLKNKQNWLVFLGRFEKVKQVYEFVQAIPTIDSKLKSEGYTDYEYYILGDGSLKNQILEYINGNNKFKNIKLHIYFESQPLNILQYSKIFFSLQKYTNYPSKSLLEGISCGNLPIVTDNCNTRKIADPSFSYYVKEQFTPENLAEECLNIVSLCEEDFDNKVSIARDFIQKNFSIEKNISYFENLYLK